MVWVIAFGELFFGDLWCVVWGYGGMRTHFSLLNPAWLHFWGKPRTLDFYPLKTATRIVVRGAIAVRWKCDCSAMGRRKPYGGEHHSHQDLRREELL